MLRIKYDFQNIGPWNLMSRRGSNTSRCSRCGGPILKGAQGGFFCCVCGLENRAFDNKGYGSRDSIDTRMFYSARGASNSRKRYRTNK